MDNISNGHQQHAFLNKKTSLQMPNLSYNNGGNNMPQSILSTLLVNKDAGSHHLQSQYAPEFSYQVAQMPRFQNHVQDQCSILVPNNNNNQVRYMHKSPFSNNVQSQSQLPYQFSSNPSSVIGNHQINKPFEQSINYSISETSNSNLHFNHNNLKNNDVIVKSEFVQSVQPHMLMFSNIDTFCSSQNSSLPQLANNCIDSHSKSYLLTDTNVSQATSASSMHVSDCKTESAIGFPAPVHSTPASTSSFTFTFSKRKMIAETLMCLTDKTKSGRVNKRPKNLTKSLIYKAGGTLDSGFSLKLLQQVIQRHINNDINLLLEKYYADFIQPALNNINNNLEDEQTNFSDTCKTTLFRGFVEECRKMYTTDNEDFNLPFPSYSNVHSRDQSPETCSEFSVKQKYRPKSRSPLFKDNAGSGRSSPASAASVPCLRQPTSFSARFSLSTNFLIGSLVNRCLGLNSKGNGRLYDKHKHLYRYVCDAQDKKYLVESGHLTSGSGARTYLLVYEEVMNLLLLSEYRTVSKRSVEKLRKSAFTLPKWLLLKVVPKEDPFTLSSHVISEPTSPLSMTGGFSVSTPVSPTSRNLFSSLD